MLYAEIKKNLGGFSLDIQLEAENGVTALLGTSGAGKSMVLKCIAGIEKPDSGRIELDGTVLFDSAKKINLPPQKRRTGYLFQNYALFPNMTVEENIAAGIPLPKQEHKAVIDEKIKAFQLTGFEKRYPSQLSGGQQQRVALARILASQPRILMLDEPFSALDSYLKWQLELEMANVLESFGGTTLFVSHNRDEVYRICDKVAVLSDGRIDKLSDKWELFAYPQTLASSLLTGCKNTSPAVKLSEHEVRALDWGLTFTCEETVPDNVRYVGIRAHCFTVCEADGTPNTFLCKIVRVIEDTFSTIVVVRNQGGQSETENGYIRWELPKERWQRLKDRPLFLHIEPKNLQLLEK